MTFDGPLYFEKDTWYRAKFEENISHISDGNVKLRPPGLLEQSDISFFFGNAYSLDIKWDTKNDIRIFQLEEFKTKLVTLINHSKMVHPVRYVHAEYDLNIKAFRHFDGAIHFYTKEDYFERRDSDMRYNSKYLTHIKPKSQKFFKLNGAISVETWVEFISHFLTGNPLNYEYYEGKYQEYLREILPLLK